MSASTKLKRDDRLLFGAGLLLLITGWEVMVRLRWLSPASYAAPTEILIAAFQLVWKHGFVKDLTTTAARALGGTLFGFPLGVAIAIGIHSLGRAQTAAERTLDFVRSIPITALIPVFIAIYGVSEANKVAIGTFSALLATAVTVWIGLKHGNDRFKTLVHLYRPNYRKTLMLILLPSTLPSLVTGLRLAVSSSLVLVVVAEMFLGTRTGIGKVINDMTYTDDRAAQYAAVLFAGLLGYALNVACECLQLRVVQNYEEASSSGAGA